VQDGSCFRGIPYGEKNAYLFGVWTYGKVEVQFQWLIRNPPFDKESARLELLQRLNEVPGIQLRSDVINRRPSFDLLLLEKPDPEAASRNTLQWAVGLLQSAQIQQ
jgi:hypothetical protein